MKKALLMLFIMMSTANADITINDVLDRTVSVKDVPQKVVLGFYYEDYLAIVGKDAVKKLVGLSLGTWQGWRPRQYAEYVKAFPELVNVPDVGNTEDGSFSIEKVVAAEPDLVILGAWNYETLGESVKKIEAAGIPIVVLDYNAQTIEKHVKSTLALGKLMGVEERAQELADNYKKQVQDVMDRVAKAEKSNKKIYIELAQKGAETYGNSYGNTMWGALIESLGGNNIAKGQVENWGALKPEYIIAQNPDIIFFSGSEWLNRPEAVPLGFSADEKIIQERIAAYLQRPAWDELNAVKNKNVHAIYHGGARTLSDYVYMQFIAKQIYPNAFKDVNPRENLQAFYDKYLPIKANGIFMYDFQ